MRTLLGAFAACALGAGGCQTQAGELSGLAAEPPLDFAVLVSGGAYLDPVPEGGRAGTFAAAGEPEPGEPVTIDELLAVLREGAVFRRIEADPDPAHRRLVSERLQAGAGDPDVLRSLADARERGFDLLLLVEQLEDGPVELQGVNGRWPITLATWFLLGVGMLIPDHTFESRATLRVSLRDLQTGRVLHDPSLDAGPTDLSLIERTDTVGILVSIVVPPFWVHDDEENVHTAVREVTRRRLLVALARELKGEPARRRLRERSLAAIQLRERDGAPWVRIESAESVVRVRLRHAGRAVEPEVEDGLLRELLASRRQEEERFVYEAPLRLRADGRLVQVIAATIGGNVASATFAPEPGR